MLVIARWDEAHDWLSNEMQRVCAGMDHATTVLTSLSYHGTAVVGSRRTFYSLALFTLSLNVRLDQPMQ